MSENKVHEAYNFKRLYNKKYGDIITLNQSHRYNHTQNGYAVPKLQTGFRNRCYCMQCGDGG